MKGGKSRKRSKGEKVGLKGGSFRSAVRELLCSPHQEQLIAYG